MIEGDNLLDTMIYEDQTYHLTYYKNTKGGEDATFCRLRIIKGDWNVQYPEMVLYAIINNRYTQPDLAFQEAQAGITDLKAKMKAYFGTDVPPGFWEKVEEIVSNLKFGADAEGLPTVVPG